MRINICNIVLEIFVVQKVSGSIGSVKCVEIFSDINTDVSPPHYYMCTHTALSVQPVAAGQPGYEVTQHSPQESLNNIS